MRVFLSWSGQRSRKVAFALRDWLPNVIQAVDPFMSSEDIPKGAQWTAKLTAELKEAAFAIICVTPENQHKAWLNFEAGALSNALTDARVCPLLLDIATTDVDGPLSVYQMAEINEADMHRVLRSLNEHAQPPLTTEKLSIAFERWWPDFRQSIESIGPVAATQASSHRTTDDMVREVLDVVRTQARTLTDLAAAMPPKLIPATSLPTTQPTASGYSTGQFVNHTQFGEGVIVDVSRSATGTLLTVMFRKSVGQKMLMAQYAPLTVISQPAKLIPRSTREELQKSTRDS